ncbi:MAG: HIT family protein [Candidatus Kerfeldbacteria bacterium]|nr:HIT family protein [Candidatus Kerfeldbacteria bacterium]
MDCIFCKIVTNTIQAVKVYEDAEFVAFLDIHPVRPGHTLVVPKVHYARFDVTPPEVVAKLWQVAQKVAAGVSRATQADGYNISINNGRAAGQVIWHTHVHIIPRVSSDGLDLWPQSEYQGSEAERVAQAIRQAIKIS